MDTYLFRQLRGGEDLRMTSDVGSIMTNIFVSEKKHKQKLNMLV